MEYITIEQDGYSIKEDVNNQYIIHFLTSQLIDVYKNDKKILFDGDNVKKLDNNLSDMHINKFIYDVGMQIFILKNLNLGIKYFDIKDFVFINNNIYLFNNINNIFELSNKLDSKESGNYGIIDFIDKDNQFLPPELENPTKNYFYFTTSYYSFGKLFLHLFNIELKNIYSTSLYYFLERCLVKNPLDRNFQYM